MIFFEEESSTLTFEVSPCTPNGRIVESIAAQFPNLRRVFGTEKGPSSKLLTGSISGKLEFNEGVRNGEFLKNFSTLVVLNDQ